MGMSCQVTVPAQGGPRRMDTMRVLASAMFVPPARGMTLRVGLQGTEN